MRVKSYQVLTSPHAGPADEHARFIPDSFAYLGFVFPGLWLLAHKLWFAGVAVLILQMLATTVMETKGLWLAGFAFNLALSLLVSLEGQRHRARVLERRGWTLQTVIVAPNLSTAETIYYGSIEVEDEGPVTHIPLPPVANGPARADAAALGLLDYSGAR